MIRRAAPSDWPAIAELCADTGRQGLPVDREERAAFGEHWIAPYRELRPDWTWIAAADDKVIGYLTGCPDTLAFEKERRRVLRPRPDSRDFFPTPVLLELWTEHPAHAHMNIADGYRGVGTGAALLRTFLAELAKAGVPSMHVICGPNAAPFWARMVFQEKASIEAAPGVMLRAMARPVD